MTSILFHFDDGETCQVSGPERAHFAILAEQFSKGIIGLVPTYFPSSRLHEHLGPFLNPENRLAQQTPGTPEWDSVLGGTLNTMGFRNGPPPFAWKGKEIGTLSLICNTVLAAGSDPMRLAVKIQFTCEHHGYVMGFHRKWLADLIDEGMEEGIYRKTMGWPDLVAKLRSGRSGPVVMSFSGSDPFPDSDIGSWMPPWPEGVPRNRDELTEEQQKERGSRSQEWYDQSFDKQWAISVRGLKAQTWNKPIDPTTLRAYRFTHEISLLDLYNQDFERVEKGLAQQ
jgi:hypothetical protein